MPGDEAALVGREDATPTRGRQALRDRSPFAGLVLLTMTTGVVGGLGAPLIPAIAAAEDVPITTAQWALTATLLVGAVASPVVGRLGTGRRRRPVMILVLAIVALGTLLAALPLGITGVITGRALQGLAFSVTPLCYSVARETVPPDRQRSAIATLSVANVVAAGLGFPVAALTAELTGVRGAFVLGAVLVAVALAVAVRVVPRSRDPHAGAVDLPGVVLLGGATLAVLLVVTQGESWGWTSPAVLACLAGGVLLGVVCWWWLRRAPNPLLDIRLASHPAVLGAHMAALLAGCGMYLMFALMMVVVQADPAVSYGLGASVTVAGLMLSPYAVASLVGNRLGLGLGPRIGPSLLLPLGCLVFALSDLLLGVLPLSIPGLVLVMVVGGIASGMTFNSIPWLVMAVVPAAETGSAMSVNTVARYLGFSIGSAIALATLDVFADDDGHATRAGFLAGSMIGVGACVLGAVTCLVLARSAARLAAPDPTPQERPA